jgi:hypothetical protein
LQKKCFLSHKEEDMQTTEGDDLTRLEVMRPDNTVAYSDMFGSILWKNGLAEGYWFRCEGCKIKMENECGRKPCIPERPMPKGDTGRWCHMNTKRGEQRDGWPSGDVQDVHCENCGLDFQVELPQ